MNPIPIGQPITPIMPALKKALEAIFKIYGKIVEIRANASLNRKGQAYITFENIDDAERAVKEANGFVLFGKPMMVQFARYDSYVSAVSDGKDLDEYKSHLKIEKEKREKLMRQVESKPGLGIAGIPGIIPQPMGVPGPYNYAGVGGPVLTANLPNKILFLQQIPSQVNKQELEHTFRSMYGFVEVRTVPGKSSIAFVEFEDEGSAIEAKNVLGNEWNLKEGQPPVLITFAKR